MSRDEDSSIDLISRALGSQPRPCPMALASFVSCLVAFVLQKSPVLLLQSHTLNFKFIECLDI